MSNGKDEPFGGDINAKVDLSNYAAKADLKNVPHVDNCSFALLPNLASLKTVVDKLDIDKLTPVPNDLAKLSNVVKNFVVKKSESDKLVGKVKNIDTKGFILKTKYDADYSKIDKILKQGNDVASKNDLDAVKSKIPNVSGFLLSTVSNSKITEVENKTPNVNNLASKSELTTVEDKIPDVSCLVAKTNYSTNIR